MVVTLGRVVAAVCAQATTMAFQAPRKAFGPRSAVAVRGSYSCAEGDYVQVDWQLRCKSGKAIPAEELMFDLGEARFVVGAGNYVSALHGSLATGGAFEVGQARTFEVSAADGFGAKDPRLGPLAVPAVQAPAGMKAGDLAGLENGMLARVVSVDASTVVIDANHFLAGEDLELDVTLLAPPAENAAGLAVAYFAGGCFWGLELAFQREVGVAATAVGYAMGDVPNPTYEAVCSGTTGHTEAVKVVYDPALVSFEKLCDLHWDRLGENRYALNRVGNDVGTQYRHGIYYADADQKAAALESKRVEGLRDPDRTIVTEILPVDVFYAAEDYHQQYLQKKGQSAKKDDATTIRCYG